MQRIGVFVCWCGSNIAGTVDVQAVSDALRNEPGVVYSTNYQYMCSQAGQDIIREAIAEHGLTGIVVCSCSPRMHEVTFRKTAAAAGLNPYMVEIANIREQCSWVHKDMPVGTEKAIILGRAAVAKVNLNAPLTPGETPVTKRALVIGGGIAGIQTALDMLADNKPIDEIVKYSHLPMEKVLELRDSQATFTAEVSLVRQQISERGLNRFYNKVIFKRFLRVLLGVFQSQLRLKVCSL